MKWDGHTHTPFCPHGSQDPLNSYIEEAIRQGFKRYSITEHAPLPSPFVDPVPYRDSAMRLADLSSYFEESQRLKIHYKSHIDIRIGLEVDYLLGFENETKHFLDQVGPMLDDSILSLHFIPIEDYWVCLDYSSDSFEKDLLSCFTSVDHVYQYYYQVLLKAVESELGTYKPNRIGHLTLIEKFIKKFPYSNREIWWTEAIEVLQAIKRKNYMLDFNTAGLEKEFCGEVYPSQAIHQQALQLGIPFVFGSDAHQAKDVGKHYSLFIESSL